MITSEELRVAALAVSEKRGKWVARRRIFRRWAAWIAWRYVLPVIGSITVIAALLGLVVWQYLGHDAAYISAQKWVQQEFGSFKTSASADNMPHSNPHNPASGSSTLSTNGSMINLTDEATLDLQIDRNLTIKTTP